jgi:hypothetical protein
VGHLDPWEGHEHPDPGGLGPHPVLVVHAARELAPATAAALQIVSDYPDRITHTITKIVVELSPPAIKNIPSQRGKRGEIIKYVPQI